MRALWLWIRTGASIPLMLVVLGAVGSSVLSSSDWHVEADWGLRLTSSTVVFVAPLVAAASAFETARRHHPAIALLANASVRGARVHLMPALATAVAATLAFVLIWVSVLITVAATGGVPMTDPWVLPETLLPVIAAAFLGCLIGHWVTGIGAPMLAVVVTFGAALLASPWGRGPFESVTTYGTLTGLERPPVQAMAGVLVGVLTVVICSAGVALKQSSCRWWIGGLAAVALVPVWVVAAAWPWADQVYRVSSEAQVCVGSEPALCGPQSRARLLALAQPNFATAYERLQGTQFAGPKEYRVTRLGHYSKLGGAAPLDFDPAFLTDGGYPMSRVADALMRPHECRELFDAKKATPILQAQGRIYPWLLDVVEGRRPAQPIPKGVIGDFSKITDCEVFTGDWK